MTSFARIVLACAAVGVGVASASTASRSAGAAAITGPLELAQNYGAPPADVGYDGSETAADSSSSLPVRIDRLEDQMRRLNGAIEQLQFQNHKLEDQLKKFQEDVDFRFQDNGRGGTLAPAAAKPQKRGDATDSLAPQDQTATTAPATPDAVSRPLRRSDAFDPASDPNAPGAPHPLGSAASAAPPLRESDALAGPDAPLDLAGGKWRAQSAETNAARPATPGAPADFAVAALTTPNAAASPINPVKEEFDVAFGYFRQKEYETAEKSFAAFLQKNPRSKMTADATYYLGESFFQRNRPREAAEQYLKISTQYSNSQRAPDAMLRLGQSLNLLGAKEQACATFAEIPHKYPNAAASVKGEADREAKRVQC